jgi:hypothetical protein
MEVRFPPIADIQAKSAFDPLRTFLFAYTVAPRLCGPWIGLSDQDHSPPQPQLLYDHRHQHVRHGQD